jgi:hypothetical protein
VRRADGRKASILVVGSIVHDDEISITVSYMLTKTWALAVVSTKNSQEVVIVPTKRNYCLW